ncbi:MAG: hypothetical protein MPK75_13135, partial [Alphaproteobacteria bacterium]|nr:hypothetical protein [Alphaproteobacteria bacterium]
SKRTWLDRYDGKMEEMEGRVEEFEEEASAIKAEAIERGRKAVPRIVARYVRKEFASLGYDLYDIKPVLDPVDFVIFNGMNRNDVRGVDLLAASAGGTHLAGIRAGIREAVDSKSYEWGVLRCKEDGTAEFEDRCGPSK